MDNITITNVKNKLYVAHGALHGCNGDAKRIATAMQNITDAIDLIDTVMLSPTEWVDPPNDNKS